MAVKSRRNWPYHFVRLRKSRMMGSSHGSSSGFTLTLIIQTFRPCSTDEWTIMHGRSHLHPCRRPAPSLISSDTTCRPDGGRGGDVDDDDGASVTVRNNISGQSDPEYGLRRVPSISLTPAPLYHGSRSPTPTLPAKPQFFAGFHFWHKPTGPLVEEDMQLVWRNLIEVSDPLSTTRPSPPPTSSPHRC